MSGKRIVFCTFGSLGDLYPLLALAREMKHRGHSPVVATSPAYRSLIEAEKIAFHPVRPDIDISDPSILRRVMDRRTGGRYLFCDLSCPNCVTPTRIRREQPQTLTCWSFTQLS